MITESKNIVYFQLGDSVAMELNKKGSHHILTYAGAKGAVVIPEHQEIDVEIIKNNMRTVGMSREEYFELLGKG